MTALHADTCNVLDNQTPCAAVGILRVKGDVVEALALSDVTVALETAATVQIICDQAIEELCGTEPRQLSGMRFDTPEHKSALAALVRCQTDTRNQPGGWWVAAAEPEAAYHAATVSMPRSEVRRMAVLSDGASRPADQMGIYQWTEYLDLLDKLGPIGLIQHVRAIETADPDGERYSRTKRHDDASVAVWSASELA